MITRENLSLIADYFGIISGCMTVLGVGGLLSWGFVRRGTGRFADLIVSIAAYVLRFGLALILILVFVAFGLWFFRIVHDPLYDLVGTLYIGLGFGWDSSLYLTLGWIVGLVIAIVCIPLYFLTLISIYGGTTEPWRRLIKALKVDRSKNIPDA